MLVLSSQVLVSCHAMPDNRLQTRFYIGSIRRINPIWKQNSTLKA